MDLELDLSEFYCLNENCPDYGKKGKGNIRVKERYGSKNRALLRCNTCTHCFSETRGTIFFGLETPDDEILRTLALVPEKGGVYVERQEPQDMIKILFADGLTSQEHIVRK